MTECNDKWTRDQKLSLLSVAMMVFFEVLDHLNVLPGVFGPAYEVVRPFVPFPLGIAVGWLACRSLYTGKIRDMETASVAEHAREIERIRSGYEKQLAELREPAETPEQRHERMLKAACADISGMREYGMLMFCDLLKIDDAVVVGFEERDSFAKSIPARLLDIKPTRSGKFSIKASAIAREAAPLVFADLRIE